MFKRIILLLIVFLYISCGERNKIMNPSGVNEEYYTKIQGSISGILTASNSPYLVIDDLIVDSLQTLNIEPGVTVHFSDSANLLIYGTLSALGNKDDFIIFSAQVDIWKGIRVIKSSQTSIIKFSIIEKVQLSYEDSTELGALEINNSNVTIKNCIIRDNEAINGAGLSIIESEAEITNNIFRDNYALVHGAGLLSFQSQSSIFNNTFYNNYCVNCGAVLSVLIPNYDSIQNNIFYNNFAQGTCDQFYYSIQDTSNYLIQYNFNALNNPDSKFIDTEELRLNDDSPCKNAGNPDVAFNDINGTRNDQGAYGGPDGDW